MYSHHSQCTVHWLVALTQSVTSLNSLPLIFVVLLFTPVVFIAQWVFAHQVSVRLYAAESICSAWGTLVGSWNGLRCGPSLNYLGFGSQHPPPTLVCYLCLARCSSIVADTSGSWSWPLDEGWKQCTQQALRSWVQRGAPTYYQASYWCSN